MSAERRLNFRYVLTPDGLVSDRALVIDGKGFIRALEAGSPPWHGTLALPGVPNAHSHVFQRAMAGCGEARRGEDSFWSWREAMYALAARVDAEALYAIARQTYAEMLAAGFTSVAEFHYLHHDVDGTAGPETADAVIAAANDAGIRLRLLPVLYQRGGFGHPPGQAQARFVHNRLEDYLQLLETLRRHRPGVAFHSLRAVAPETLASALRATERVLGEGFPVHIHIAEQRDEVEACRQATGTTPIQALVEAAPVDSRWALVHATHAEPAELQAVRERGATVVVCPLTEAYLGDGLFAGRDYIGRGGVVAVGSDSNARIDAVEELRLLEYGQRLADQARARFSDARGLGVALWTRACAGGARALDLPVGALSPGHTADLVVLEPGPEALLGHPPERWIDALVIAGSRATLAAVYVAGQRRVEGGDWAGRVEIARRYDAAVKPLLEN